MDRVIFALVNNEPEVLMRIAGFLRRMGFNIKSISMSETASNPSIAHLMIKTEEKNQNIERAIKNIEKFINVYTVVKIDDSNLFLKKRDAANKKRNESNLYELLNIIGMPDHEALGKRVLRNTGTNGIM